MQGSQNENGNVNATVTDLAAICTGFMQRDDGTETERCVWDMVDVEGGASYGTLIVCMFPLGAVIHRELAGKPPEIGAGSGRSIITVFRAIALHKKHRCARAISDMLRELVLRLLQHPHKVQVPNI